MRTIASVRYMGSKKKLLLFIYPIIASRIPAGGKLIDLFSGAGHVGCAFSFDCDVVSNDKQDLSRVINECYLLNQDTPDFYQPYINHLNNLTGEIGFITQNYASDTLDTTIRLSDGKKALLTCKNAMRIDAIRQEIENLEVNDIQKSVLLTSLLLAMDKVTTDVGHQNGYLKKWSNRSLIDLQLVVPPIWVNTRTHQVFQGDYKNILTTPCDVLYVDPPYGTQNQTLVVSARYSAFYHVYNTLIKNDKPQTFGKANRRIDTKGFTDAIEKNIKAVVAPVFKGILDSCQAKCVCFSYSNQGLLKLSDFQELGAGRKMTYYTTTHTRNNQTVLAKKDGRFITGEQQKELLEYLIVYE